MLRCFSVERLSSHGGGGGTYLPARPSRRPSSQNGMQSEHLKDGRRERRGLHRDQGGERATCCYCGWLLALPSVSTLVHSLARPSFLVSSSETSVFSRSTVAAATAGESVEATSANGRTDGPTDAGFERVANAVQCLFLLSFIQRIKKERDRIIYRSRSAIGGRT